MRDSSGAKPTLHEVYKRLVEEYLKVHPLDQKFRDAARQLFRQGPTKVCSKQIGRWIGEELDEREITPQELATGIGVEESVVAEWIAGGDISLGLLVLVLMELDVDFEELPLPVRKELATEGYLLLVSHIRAELSGPSEPFDRERFWCLYHLCSRGYWWDAAWKHDATLLDEEAKYIREEAKNSLRRRLRKITGVGDIKRLVSEWMIPWVVCLEILPRNWTVQ